MSPDKRDLIVIVDRFRGVDKTPFLEVWDVAPPVPIRVRRCDVAIGKKGFETPHAVFRTSSKSREPNWLAPRWAEPPLEPGVEYEYGHIYNPYQHGLISLVGFNPRTQKPLTGFAIHGTTNEVSIPGYASHGCTRLRKKDILALYDLLPEGTPVIFV